MKQVFLILLSICVFAQVEHIHIYHPVYDFLLRLESKGFVEHGSFTDLPLQRKQIVEIISNTDEKSLNKTEIKSLNRFKDEFRLNKREEKVLVTNSSFPNQVFFSGFFDDSEKYFYRYEDSINSLSIRPLANTEFRMLDNGNSDNVIFANAGLRFFGTIDNKLGYNLQVTNGSALAGNEDLLLADDRIGQNVKFTVWDSDFDFTESHVRFDYRWFYSYISRENRLLGAGLNQRLFLSDNTTPMDHLALGARFKYFEYKFSHSSLLSSPVDSIGDRNLPIVGVDSRFIDKFSVTHRFSFRPSWGEISLWENIVYSDRGFDLAYLNPLSFLKSLEHSLRDRDNSSMGLDLTYRFMKRFQLKGTYLLDDIIFSEIGNNFWSNKTAYNLALITALPFNLDLGIEYARNEPYVFSHFAQVVPVTLDGNSMTSDGKLFTGYNPPNSEELSLSLRYWWGSRYPFKLDFSYLRHGRNILDENGNIVRNVGGDEFVSRRFEDSERVSFLDGELNEIFNTTANFTFELSSGFNLALIYSFTKQSILENPEHLFRINFRFSEFNR